MVAVIRRGGGLFKTERMKRRYAFIKNLIFASTLAWAGGCQYNESRDRALIMQNFDFQAQCWNKGDTKCYCDAYADLDSIRTISRAGVTYGKRQILADYQKYFPPERMGHLSFDQFEMERLSAEYYFVTGRFTLSYESRDPRSGYFSVIMKKIGDEWKIYTDHSS